MRLGAKHRGFDMTAMEIIDATLLASGWPDAETVLRRALGRCDAAVSRRAFPDGFPQPDRRFHFAPDWAALGDEPRRDAAAAGPDGQYRRRPAPTRRSAW